MPYELVEIKGISGYKKWKVCKKGDIKKCFSKEPLTKTRAQAQMKALYASENNRTNRGKLIAILVKEYNFDEEEVTKKVNKLDPKVTRKILKEV